METAPGDLWSDWLLHGRHADDSAYAALVQVAIDSIADRVLDGARLAAGMHVIDVGSGDGLLAFRAIERIGPSLTVHLTDISPALIHHAAQRALDTALVRQTTFSTGNAERLHAIDDACADAVLTRASLAYVANKQAAFDELYRVLKPGGRLSIAEPIFQDDAFYACMLRRQVSDEPAEQINPFMVLLHRWQAAQFPDTQELCALSPLTNFSERDLLTFARRSGFANLHLEMHIDETRSRNRDWEVFLAVSPHPWAPSLKTILAEQFSPAERELFEQLMRPNIESGRGLSVDREAYLTAIKPAVSAPSG